LLAVAVEQGQEVQIVMVAVAVEQVDTLLLQVFH
jgi:hypothetical protein